MKVSVFMLRNSAKSRSAFIFLISCNLFRILEAKEKYEKCKNVTDADEHIRVIAWRISRTDNHAASIVIRTDYFFLAHVTLHIICCQACTMCTLKTKDVIIYYTARPFYLIVENNHHFLSPYLSRIFIDRKKSKLIYDSIYKRF